MTFIRSLELIKMKQFLFIIFILNIGIANSQEIAKDESNSCACIDRLFSSSTDKPIAIINNNDRLFAFCGYASQATKYRRDCGILRPDSTFLLSGFVLIDCITKQVAFSEGEYYTDSVRLKKDGFELYRQINLPNPNGGRYISVPVLQFKVHKNNDGFAVDTIFVIPKSFYETDYLNQIKKNLNLLRSDSLKQMEADGLQLSYLFLRTLENKENKKSFEDKAQRDGYLGRIFNDYNLYLKFKEKQ